MQILNFLFIIFIGLSSPINHHIDNNVQLFSDSIPHSGEVHSFDINYVPNLIPESQYAGIFAQYPSYISDGFDFPVGYPDATNYYKAQNFGESRHLGEDWNAVTGGNTDLGDPVFATANGLVTFAEEVCCGWGNVVRVIHSTPNDSKQKYVESVYAHLEEIDVRVGHLLKRGQLVGTIGTAGGIYPAHLHFEMRDFINMSIGPGYSDDQFGYLDPTKYINLHRPKN